MTMGFIEKGVQEPAKLTVQTEDSAYLLLAAGDYLGAWLLLRNADSKDSAAALYNKALCQLRMGRDEEAYLTLQQAKQAAPAATPGQKNAFLEAAREVLKAQDQPQTVWIPLSWQLTAENPPYAELKITWLLLYCCRRCGRRQEALDLKAKLEQYGIQSINELLEL
ncbi:hypothetical protein A3207_00950 [Candidatus Methanomassiliicoccus intestinalis]|jgi:hypothetical protein|uniref:Tetratricopeptide repeat protein n=2 Tax=Candidatus Methanomassiliicoccus intestinalis TaxID=1406512 RepID=A0A8J8PFG0_9ARCH|nr:MAG: hypothetical protein A3207_00950 [Candidatus Methanomassiliicoccus intestinalis]